MMAEFQEVDISQLAILAGKFSLRLMQLGFRLIQRMDTARHDHQCYVLPPTCEVPTGPFHMGGGGYDSRDHLLTPHLSGTLAFRIGTYPVTVAEYLYAVEAGAVGEPQTMGKVSWQQQLYHLDHPVVCISWHHATAYAAWLATVSQRLWRLPTEAEWEKAARGPDGYLYPWGNQWDKTRANTTDGGPQTTTPVGAYAEAGDASSYGAHDMAGNVSEWTSSIYQRYPYQPDKAENDADTQSNRVLRGGSLIKAPQHACTAYRYIHSPSIFAFGESFGMRLAQSTRPRAK